MVRLASVFIEDIAKILIENNMFSGKDLIVSLFCYKRSMIILNTAHCSLAFIAGRSIAVSVSFDNRCHLKVMDITTIVVER